MTDYLPLLSRAVSGLERNTGEARRSVYDRARQALLNQLRSMNPPLAESEITRERLALEEAIRRIETQATKPPPPPPRPERPSPPPPEERAAPPPPPAPPPPAASLPARASASSTRPADGSRVVREAVEAVEKLEAGTPPAPRAKPAPRMPGSVPPGDPLVPPSVPSSRRAAKAARGEIPADAFDIDYEIESQPMPAPPPRGPRAPEPSLDTIAEPSPQPRPFRGRNVDFAKADAQKAMKAKLIVGGTIAALFAVAILIGIVHRDRIFSMGTSSPRPAAPSTTASEPPKASDRVPADAPAAQSSRPPAAAPQGGLAAAVAQRAVLYEENPSGGGQQLQTFVGTVVWKTETVNPGPGRPPELGMRIEVEVPDRKMTVVMTIRRNPDTTLPASHTVEVQFTSPGDPFGGVSNVPGLRAKTTETAQGAPLSGLVVRVMPGFFLIGLSAIDADREQNLLLLRERGWLDLPFVYNNGRRAVLVIEKGAPGERAMNEALTAWGG